MLVLSRKINEQIRISDDITVTILAITGNVVKIGFDAPSDVRIMRHELLEGSKEKQKS